MFRSIYFHKRPRPQRPVSAVQIRDSFNGKSVAVGSIDIYLYELPSAERLYRELQETEKLRTTGNDADAAKFFSAYDRLEQDVRSGRFSARHAISDKQGTFVFNQLAAGKDYLILAIGLNVEDEATYYNFQKLTLHADRNEITIRMEPEGPRDVSQTAQAAAR